MNDVMNNKLGSHVLEGDVIRNLGSISAIQMDRYGRLPLNVDPNAVRRPPLYHPGRMRGSLISKKNNCRVEWESSLERDAFRLLEWHPYISGYRAQPFTLTYDWHGEKLSYTPDIFVQTGGGLVVEIKPAKRVRTPEFVVWAGAIAAACRKKGYRFSVWTETELRVEPRTSNVAYLLSCRRHPRREDLAEAIRAHVYRLPGVTPSALRSLMGGGNDARVAILRAMAWHEVGYEIECELDSSPLTPGALS